MNTQSRSEKQPSQATVEEQPPLVTAEELPTRLGQTVRLYAAIYKVRKMSGFSFVLLRMDRRVVQSVYERDTAAFDEALLQEESFAEITALVAAEERARAGYELRLRNIQILSAPEEISPIVIHNKCVDTSLENLLDYRPVTLRNEKERAIFRIQAALCRAFRDFLEENRFTEIHSPKLVQEGAEGGANIFRLDYFGQEAYLTQSPQFYKQAMVGVFDRVYEIGPVFRAEKHDTARHLNEYTSVDFEMGYLNSFSELMDMETAMLAAAFQQLQTTCAYELSLLSVKLPVLAEIPRIRFSEAKALVARTYGRAIRDMEDFEPEEEKLLCAAMERQTGSEFVFVTHYPEKKRPFYAMEDAENSAETLSFDLLFRGLEITTGGQRIHQYAAQVEKMRRRGMDIERFESYLMAHRYGLPPHGGLGLGLERLTSRLLGFDNVRRATLFPRDINRLTP